MPGTTSTALSSFSHDQHHKTNAAKRKREGAADCNVAVGSHGQYNTGRPRKTTFTSAAAWWVKRPGDLDLWPRKWCPSQEWHGLPLPILVFLGLSVLDLGPMYATDRQTSVRQTDFRQHHRLMPPYRGRGHNNQLLAVNSKVGLIASEEVVLQLTTSKCMPILLYGLEALPLNKSQLSSLDFMVNRFLMKLFNSNDMQTIEFCRLQFNFKLPSEI